MLGFLATTATTVPDPATVAGDLANNAGGAVINAIVSVLPVLIPVLVALWAISFVWKKVGPKKGAIR